MDFEHWLPKKLQKDLMGVITRSPDSDSDEDLITNYISKQTQLFKDENYQLNEDGLYVDPTD